ncbi:MAG: ImmA/IrrE family metallo-endopeptidase [Gemmatimonadota bacterium]
MHSTKAGLIFFATDISNFLACPQLTLLDRRAALGGPKPPVFDDPAIEVLRKRGEEHEQNFLARLQAEGKTISLITEPAEHLPAIEKWRTMAALTLDELRRGVDVVYQGVLFSEPWGGKPDFLITWTAVDTAWNRDASEDQEPRCYARLENLANVFAAHLLLPAESLTTHFNARIKDGRMTYLDLIQLARDFGVSTHALLNRLRTLGRFSQAEVDRVRADEQFQAADRRSIASAWNSTPEVPFTTRYRDLAKRAYRQGTIGISKLAEILEQPIGELMEFEQDLSYAGEATITVA